MQILPKWLHATLPLYASTYPLQSLLAPCAACPTGCPPQKPSPSFVPINSPRNPLHRRMARPKNTHGASPLPGLDGATRTAAKKTLCD